MMKRNIQIVNVPGQVTFRRVIGNNVQEAIIDVIMTNIDNTANIQYNNTFIDSKNCSDHYVNVAELYGIEIHDNQTISNHGDVMIEKWNLRNITDEHIMKYKSDIQQKGILLLKAVKKDKYMRNKYPVQFCAALCATTMKMIENSARNHICTEIIRNKGRKSYITPKIMEYIEFIRYNKKRYRSMWRAVRKIKRKY